MVNKLTALLSDQVKTEAVVYHKIFLGIFKDSKKV